MTEQAKGEEEKDKREEEKEEKFLTAGERERIEWRCLWKED